MPLNFLFVALGLAVLDWVAVAKGLIRFGYFTKPAVIIALLIWMGTIGGYSGPLAWFSIGLLFSLMGDIFLMLPRERFLLGIASFGLAQIAYTVGFNLPVAAPLTVAAVILALFVGGAVAQVGSRVLKGLSNPRLRALRLPVLIYVVLLSLMALSALLTITRREWAITPALLVSIGALLFLVSDSLIFLNRFVSQISHARLKVRITYHLAQILIVLGAALRFLFPI
jgi:uncharacterized membrane protein YhhN